MPHDLLEGVAVGRVIMFALLASLPLIAITITALLERKDRDDRD